MPQPLDLLLRLESIEEDLAALKRAVGYAAADVCPLKEERVAAQKPRGVPAKPALLALLAREPALMQAVCNVYIQDFLCLGYPLPAACRVEPPPPAMPDAKDAAATGGQAAEAAPAAAAAPRRRQRQGARRNSNWKKPHAAQRTGTE